MKRIVFDGFNLSLSQGTGITTYSRVLARVAREIGHDVGVVYSTPQAPPKGPLAREIAFFDAPKAIRISPVREIVGDVIDQLAYYFPVKPKSVKFSGAVVNREFYESFPVEHEAHVARNLFSNARRYYARTGTFPALKFDQRPDVFHCTYQLPLQVKNACNIYTIHDLIPLRLPFTTLDNKRYMLRLLRRIAASADHIVTVSEQSKRDIIEILGVDEKRVTNTYQSVILPQHAELMSEDQIADQVGALFGLDIYNYLIFFGALEPKKNIARLIDAYLSSGVDIPLLLVGGEGWQTEAEQKLLLQLEKVHPFEKAKRRIQRVNYVSQATLVTLIRGARALVFPSLYEGFGLPVLEAMALGTPVVTSSISSVPEVAGDAAILVDPYDTLAISRAIATIVADAGLRNELSQRGRSQAANFSLGRYRERMQAFYASVS